MAPSINNNKTAHFFIVFQTSQQLLKDFHRFPLPSFGKVILNQRNYKGYFDANIRVRFILNEIPHDLENFKKTSFLMKTLKCPFLQAEYKALNPYLFFLLIRWSGSIEDMRYLLLKSIIRQINKKL